MKLGEAVRDAFGRSHYVRRKKWRPGSYVCIDYGSDEVEPPLSVPIGSGGHIVTVSDDDREADDWQPCIVGAEPAIEDWSDRLCCGHGSTRRRLERGQKCRVMLDGVPLPGEWKLSWAEPYFIMMEVTPDSRTGAWPEIREGTFSQLNRLLLSAADIEIAFHLSESRYSIPRSREGVRLYQFMVVRLDAARFGDDEEPLEPRPAPR